MNLTLEFTLQSETAFGRGDGVAGAVDAEVQYDSFGFPYLHGRTLKGMLAEECANFLYTLRQAETPTNWKTVAAQLFGKEGSTPDDAGALSVGNAELPAALRSAVAAATNAKAPTLTADQVLQSLTTVRWRTAIDAEKGSPLKETLRSERVILRGLTFSSPITLDYPTVESEPTHQERDNALALLAACVAAFRRAGRGRNRGQGALRARLLREDGTVLPATWLESFLKEVRSCSPVN